MPVHANIEPLAWESEFFALPTARLHFSDDAPLLEQKQLADYARVQAKIPTDRYDLLDILQAMGFRLAESECDFLLSIPAVIPSEPAVSIATAADLPALQQLAAHSFQHSRFRPPWYTNEDSPRFYACWVTKAVEGTFDHHCLLVRADTNKPDSDACLGFVTLRKLDDNQARIGLLAGRGQGARLMSAAQHWCAQRAIRRLYVATQSANIAAIRRYTLSGALIHNTAYWLYK